MVQENTNDLHTQVLTYILDVRPAAHRAEMLTRVPAAFLIAYFAVLSEFGAARISPFKPEDEGKPLQDMHGLCEWLALRIANEYSEALTRSNLDPESLLAELRRAGFSHKAADSFFTWIGRIIPMCREVEKVCGPAVSTRRRRVSRQHCCA